MLLFFGYGVLCVSCVTRLMFVSSLITYSYVCSVLCVLGSILSRTSLCISYVLDPALCLSLPLTLSMSLSLSLLWCVVVWREAAAVGGAVHPQEINGPPGFCYFSDSWVCRCADPFSGTVVVVSRDFCPWPPRTPILCALVSPSIEVLLVSPLCISLHSGFVCVFVLHVCPFYYRVLTLHICHPTHSRNIFFYSVCNYCKRILWWSCFSYEVRRERREKARVMAAV